MIVVMFGTVGWRSFAQFSHQRHVLLVNLSFVTSCSSSSSWTTHAWTLRATITSDVTGTTATRTHDIIGNVRFVGAQPRFVIACPAVRATRTIVLTKSSVEQGKLSKLITSQIVLPFWDFDALPNYLVNLKIILDMFHC